MNTDNKDLELFVANYIKAWSTEDDNLREELVTKLYSSDADFYADEPGDGPVKRHGIAEIINNIKQVNVRLVQGKGLFTESTGYAVNHDVIRVSWKMTTPDGNVVMTGMNVLTCNDQNKVTRDYIFIG
jgi:hypothetical protein